jgi:chaperone required for assembly of F1-ATPase
MPKPPDLANPMHAAQKNARQALPKRFYKSATAGPVEGGFGILLDGRPVKTPAKKSLTIADERLALVLAAEWEAQGETISPGDMPLTRIVNAAIDHVAGEMAAVRADIVAHAATDLICYRAEEPDSLVAAQEAAWSPLVAFAREALGAHLVLGAGIVHVPQNPEALAAINAALAPFNALGLAALHTITTLSGSAVIALALAKGAATPEEAWTAAHVDEDFQMLRWGKDDIALAQRAGRRREFDAAALILAAGPG